MKKYFAFLVTLCIIFAAGCSGSAGMSSSSASHLGSTSNEQAENSINYAAPAATAAGAPAAAAPGGNYNSSALGSPDYSVPNSEQYLSINANSFLDAAANPLLTFSLKVDTASYRNVVRYINSGSLPPVDAVRTEEFINYFKYDMPMPEPDGPFSLYTEVGRSLFDSSKYMAFIRVKSKDIDRENLAPSNLTFLIDTSGSMDSYDKLPLLQSAFDLLTETLTENDTVSLVTYAGASTVLLDSVSGGSKPEIENAINSLQAGGSTAGANGIITAYALAEKNFKPNGNNRVILATDGDFNVGVSSDSDLERLISDKRDTGVYLSVLGVGMGNLKDDRMETLAKNGNGNYNYIDSLSEAKKVLVDELSANLYTIADDVKAQVEFNPALVSSYRLIGYENSEMPNQDFNNDQKDAGEIGVGTDVVLMFELTLENENQGYKYQTPAPQPDNGPYSDELFEVRIRYKDPGSSTSKLITQPVKTDQIYNENSSDFCFASAVAGFADILRNSQYTGDLTINGVINQAEENLGEDPDGYRREFVQIAQTYRRIAGY